MQDILKIVRPPVVEVELFETKYKLKRLSYGDVIDLIGALSDLQGLTKGAITREKILGCRPALDILMERSFPEFDGWDEVPVSMVPGLLGVIWEANDISAVIANFTRLAGRMPAKKK